MSIVSTRTIALACAGLAVPVGAAFVLSSGWFGAAGQTAWILADVAIVGIVSASLFITARKFPRGWRFRHQFSMMGGAALLYSIAGFCCLHPSPLGEGGPAWLPASLYAAGIVLLAGGVWSVLRGFSVFGQTRAVLGGCVVLAASAAVALYFVALDDLASDVSLSVTERVLAVWQPAGDLVLLLAPTMALTIVVTAVGGGRLTRPWWLLALGFWGLAVTDTLQAVGNPGALHVSGSALDAGWWLSYALVAVGASVMLDLNQLSERPVVVTPAIQEGKAGGS